MKNGRRFTISLSALSIISITAAAVTAMSVCLAVFTTVYSRALLRDASVSSEQNVQQTALAMDNYLYSMKNQLEQIVLTMDNYTEADSFAEDISVITRTQSDIYAVMIYDAQGNILRQEVTSD